MDDNLKTIAKAVHAVGAVVLAGSNPDATGRQRLLQCMSEIEQLLIAAGKKNDGD